MEIISANSASNRMYPLPESSGDRFYSLQSEGIPYRVTKGAPVGKNDSLEARKVKLREAAKGFEAIFARQILKTMRSTLTDGGMFGEGATGEIFSDMMDNAIAEKIAERSELGLADAIYRQMVKSIERQDSSATNTALEK